jgi:hypothetical protein
MRLEMNALLPDYDPPQVRRAALAVGAAPLVVLVVFTLIVWRWIDPSTGLAWFGASTLWVVHEMNQFQKAIDGYNAAYARRHLDGRSIEALQALAQAAEVSAPTREFVQRFLAAERRVLRDGQVP